MEHPARDGGAGGQLTSGWRYWQLAPESGRLRSVSQRRVEWAPARPLRAFCMAAAHPSPAERCNCGIYAAFDLQDLRRQRLCLAPEALVVGKVELWGRLSVSEDGFRGEYAYPATLAVVEETLTTRSVGQAAEQLSAYGVPVTTMPLAQAVGDVARAVMANLAISARTR